MELLPFFEWLETSLLGQAAKAYGGTYAMVQSLHLFSMALLGGAVITTDLRLLNVIFRDVPSKVVTDNAHKWFKLGLALILLSGVFMAAGVAIKVYHNDFFWAKMIALAAGIVFVFAVKRPLLVQDHEQLKPWVLKGVAVASILVWFTVAATGRWIGFS
ncbi:DUF6644 family protein [Gilvimarinus sp. F26214L]|uniref:DUF6644 family protein n=1 Tax=Gilvimarinus sp. DZF01 TaxID=3461371 RepID=UPI004045B4F7